jgi:5-phospho-D-xylono-1,4-lactonase
VVVTGCVRTVLGDVDAAELGVTDSHDHLFFRSPKLPGAELDDPGLALAEATAFAAAGGRTVVQWTPCGLGRGRPFLARISATCGVHVVSATGRHRAEHHDDGSPGEAVDELAAAFVADIEHPDTPCGVVKIGTGYHHLDAWERTSLAAAALAHHATGAPILIHLELGTGGDLVLDELGRHGVAPDAIVLGHVGRHPEDGTLLQLAASGAYLCFDGPSRANHRTDWRTPQCIRLLVERGHADQLLVGGDTTTSAARSVIGGPGLPGLLTRFGHTLRETIGAEHHRAIFVGNPARAFALRRH